MKSLGVSPCTWVCLVCTWVCAWGFACSTATKGDGKDELVKPDAAVNEPKCGDGVCASSEAETCVTDCGTKPMCGDGMCNGEETMTSCPGDCPAACGNGSCDAPKENEFTCTMDCPSVAPEGCAACVYDAGCSEFLFGIGLGAYTSAILEDPNVQICNHNGTCETNFPMLPVAGKPELSDCADCM